MGMSIEEAHGILSNGLANAPSEHEWCVAFKMAIDTMRKYQKIEQIVENVDKRHYGYSTMMDYLHEVLDNGND